jgi:hypothetical protein
MLSEGANKVRQAAARRLGLDQRITGEDTDPMSKILRLLPLGSVTIRA